MQVNELIRAFSNQEKLPVDVNDVLQCLRDNGCDDDISFIGVEMDPDILQGAIKVFHVRPTLYSADTSRHANIYYHRGHTTDWQRIICAKELLHLLDPESAYTKDSDAIDKLAEKIGLPPEMQDPLADGLETNVDRTAEFSALALLFPMAARNLLMAPYRDGKLKLGDIAKMADIPLRYVGFVMSEVWASVAAILSQDLPPE